MEKITLSVDGMSCSHCVSAIKKAVGAIDGVSSVEVDLDTNTVSVAYQSQVTLEQIKEEIEDQGYEVI